MRGSGPWMGAAAVALLAAQAAAALSLADGSGTGSGLPQEWTALAEQHPALQGQKIELRWAQKPVSLPACAVPSQLRWLGAKPPPGLVSLEVLCPGPRPWRRQLSLEVQVWTHHWVAKRNLPAGHRLAPDDFKPVHGPKGRMAGELAADPGQWAGQELARPLSEGQPLRLNNWRVLTVIRRGMEVQVKILGKGFEITSSGVALTDAAQGASLQVRGKDGKTFQALAVAEGWAEIRMD